MKICLFADAQSVHIRKLAGGMVARGHRVHVVTHKPCDLDGVTVERFAVPPPSFANPRRWTGRRFRYLTSFLDDFDVVNVHFLADWGFTPEMFRRGGLIATAWGSDVVDPPGETPASADLVATRVELLQNAAAVTTCGPSFADVVAAYAGMKRDRIEVVPFGVDLKRFKSVGTRQSDPRGARRIGFFKGFRAVYGAPNLVRAMPMILRRHPDVRLEMVGDGDQWDLCHSLADELGIAHAVDWIPRTPNDGIPALLQRGAMSVIPSVSEAFGVAALESSALQIPVVASDVCGLRDTVRHGETGLLVPSANAQALADAVVMLLDDPDTRERFGRAGRAMVERWYGLESTCDAWEALYTRLRERRCVMI